MRREGNVPEAGYYEGKGEGGKEERREKKKVGYFCEEGAACLHG